MSQAGAFSSVPDDRGEQATCSVGGGAMEKVSSVTAMAQDVASSIAERAEGVFTEAAPGAEGVASRVAAKAGEAADAVRRQAKDAVGELTVLMWRYPVPTLCVGLGLGFLTARLLGRQAACRRQPG